MKKTFLKIFSIIAILLFVINCENTTNQSAPNIALSAAFDITPGLGFIETTFTFDASGCNDAEDDLSQLQVRWDWESDGTWDTDYTIEKTTTHQYTSAGDYEITLEVMNSGDSTVTVTKTVSVTGGGFDDIEYGKVTDHEGNEYKTVVIGNQEWMAENLKVTTYRNGDPIFNYWADETNDTNISEILYFWNAVNDSRNIAPAGWHVPSDAEWKKLEMYIGMNQFEADKEYWRGTDLSNKLKSTTGWDRNQNGTDDYGFTALPVGFIEDFENKNIGCSAYFWSAKEEYDGSYVAWSREFTGSHSGIRRYRYSKALGFSVRLVKDDIETVTDIDGKVYKTQQFPVEGT